MDRRRPTVSGGSPYIYPPLKNAASRRVRGVKSDRFEGEGADVAGSTGIFAVEVVDQFRSMGVRRYFPGVVFPTESLPLDKIL